MSEIISQGAKSRQTPTRDRVTAAFARLRGISQEAGHALIRKIESEHEGLIRFYAREGAMNRIERLQVRSRLAARPTTALDYSDKAHAESIARVFEIDQRADCARFFTALDGPLPIEEETELRANYALLAEVRARCEVLEARREARKS